MPFDHERLGGKIDVAHDRVLRAVAEAVVEGEESRAEGRAGDALVAQHRADGGDEQQGQHGDADNAAGAEGDAPRR